MQIYGYGTTIANAGQVLNQGGKVARVGDEVLSPYWNAADSTLPVSIRQLNQFHTQGNTATLYWFAQGSSTTTSLFTADGEEGQSFLPHTNVAAIGQVGTSYAQGSFSSSGAFGFKIDNEWSDDAKNVQDKSGGNYGHHVRFWVAKDRDGKIIPNTFIMSMDYSGINYDYQDNVYLVTNIKPVSPPAVPTGLIASASGAGIALDWTDNTDANLAGYNVYRASSSAGPFTKLNTQLVTTSDFIDASAPLNATSYYRVTAVDNAGTESNQGNTANATRTNDTTKPAMPKSLVATGSTSGITLDWADNTDVDLAGYNVFRGPSASGPWTKLTPSLITTSGFFDSGAQAGATSFYQVFAVDTSNNISDPATTSATRPSNDTTKPGVPNITSTTPDTTGISKDLPAGSLALDTHSGRLCFTLTGSFQSAAPTIPLCETLSKQDDSGKSTK